MECEYISHVEIPNHDQRAKWLVVRNSWEAPCGCPKEDFRCCTLCLSRMFAGRRNQCAVCQETYPVGATIDRIQRIRNGDTDGK